MGWKSSVAMMPLVLWGGLMRPAQAEAGLVVAYPPANHQTTAAQIFLIGTAPIAGVVTVNGQAITRNSAGHFAPSFPLKVGDNRFEVRYQNQVITLTITRLDTRPKVPTSLAFAQDSLQPAVAIARLPGEVVCFEAIAPPTGRVMVQVGDRQLALQPQVASVELPPNYAVLTRQNQPTPIAQTGLFQGCTVFDRPMAATVPRFTLTFNGQTLTQPAPGTVTILEPNRFRAAIVTAEAGVARTGPSTDYSRLTPLPQGTQALVTGQEGSWLRLDYGAWIRSSEVQVVDVAIPPRSLIRSLKTRDLPDWTEVHFPLQVPVPVTITQEDRLFSITLHNTVAQTDTIYAPPNRLLDRLDWQQITPTQVRYQLRFKPRQQWGYTLRYEGTTLVLALRHPPDRQNITVLLDPGHGGDADIGARGPTGYPEKAAALTISQLLRAELEQRGLRVVMTREADTDVGLAARVALIQQTQPTIALSLHYNALPDDGDALNTSGVAVFWFHPQAYSLAVFLHDYLVQRLHRPSDGVFWNNLALTRPTIAPSLLLELGYMINPDEYEWIMDPKAQQQLAATLADGVVAWIDQQLAPD
ncbi:MAG: N-acetylmuramoyl-L-alanine amidase [Cyanobacteria bacterium]|nr:N-acetylmuramoyl-L-alanine amidase [Cyanobacteriota bacterium]MDW8199662.1 N-acetylmuramoyl-L-alanine amidase [Cyanobacteriota bacterium SKYGB_h_bin112]